MGGVPSPIPPAPVTPFLSVGTFVRDAIGKEGNP